MIHDKKFFVQDADTPSKIFNIEIGLQQGTFNPLILFNVLNSDLLKTYGKEKDPYISASVFADDLIIMVKIKDSDIIKNKLEDLYTLNLRTTTRLKVNDKSETILFRQNKKILFQNKQNGEILV